MFLLVFSCNQAEAQVNNYFNFQGLILDDLGDEMKNKELEMVISITQDQAGSSVVYSENHFLRTNEGGVFTVVIGSGNPLVASFDQIQWLEYIPYIQMEYLLNSTSTWKKLTASKFHSVPFALYAHKIVCQKGPPGIGKMGLPGFPGPSGPAAGVGATGPPGVNGPLGQLDMTNVIPNSDLRNGEIYLDDGTNRQDGNPGFRYYDLPNETWVDL